MNEDKETEAQRWWGQERCVSVKEEGIVGKRMTGISKMAGSMPNQSSEIAQNELTVGLTPGQDFMCAGAENVLLC